MTDADQLIAILDTVGEGVITIGTDQRIRVVNREVERIFGYPRAELLGASVQILMPEPFRPRHDVAFRQCIDDPEATNSLIYREFEGRRKDGSLFPLELRFTHVRTRNELLFTAAVRDVTERRQAAAKIERLQRELEQERDYLREEVRQTGQFGDIIGNSEAIRMTMTRVDAVAKTDASVLVEGESGVGKELIARAIHERSPRARHPLVRVNCAAIPESLFESEFFGHVKGAFTGALHDRVGRFQLANGGTIFLDEIGEVPLELQSKLLRVLQEQQFERVGADHTTTVDVRIVAATNRSLSDEVAAGRFRSDLFFRLSVFPIEVPPLRDRPADIEPLTRHLVARAAERLNARPARITKTTLRALEGYAWPGNVRELQNVLERGLILAAGGVLRPEMLSLSGGPLGQGSSTGSRRRRRLDKETIVASLARNDGVVSHTAEELGISRQALYRRMAKLGIPTN